MHAVERKGGRQHRKVAGRLAAVRQRFADHPLRGVATLAITTAWGLVLAVLALSPGLLVVAAAAFCLSGIGLILLIILGPHPRPAGQSVPVPKPRQSLFGDRASPPRYETELVGRDRDVVAVAELIQRMRAVTLLGPPGVGKTRLAAEIAVQAETGLPDGCCWISLAPISDDGLLLKTIAGWLSLWDGVDLDGVVRFLSDKRVLLVLDNVEQLKGAAPILHEVLNRCPGVRALATSRDMVLPSWQTYRVRPLAVASSPTGERAKPSPSASVFIGRARRRDAGLQFSRQDLAAIEKICTLLAGLPLPIELAAGRLPTLTPPEVLASLKAGQAVLWSNDPDEDVRHRTMEGAVRWSDKLLSPSERLMFRRASLFDGGLSQTAAIAVCAAGQDEALVLIEALVDASLLSPMPESPLEPRYRMLEPIRQAALAMLSDDRAEAERLRFGYCLDLARRSEANLGNRQALQWAAALEIEQPNMRGALQWAIESDPNGALELAVALFQFWNLHGHIKEGLTWLERALNAATAPSPELRDKAQNRIAALVRLGGDTAKARHLYEEVLTRTREEDDPWNRSFALNGLGHLALSDDHPDMARTFFEASLRIRLARPSLYGGAAVTLTNLGDLALHYESDRAVARRLYGQSLAIRTDHNDLPGIPISRLKLAILELSEGRLDVATSLLSQAVAAFTELGDRKWLASCLDAAAELALARQGPTAAATACGAAEALREALGIVRAPFEIRAFDRVAGQARDALRGEFTAALTVGRKTPVADVFVLVLQPDVEPPDHHASA
jgi:predicted ATPase